MTGRSTVSAPGLPALRQALARLPEAAAAEVVGALDALGDDVVAEAKRSLGTVSPSADAGVLEASLGTARNELQVTVTAADPRAADLEYGTRTMAARPFLRPAAAAVAATAGAKLRAALLRAAGSLR